MEGILGILSVVAVIMVIGMVLETLKNNIYHIKKSKYIEDRYGFYAPIKFDHFIELFAITPEDLRKDTWELKDSNIVRHVVEYKMIKNITEAQKNNWRFIRWVNPEEKDIKSEESLALVETSTIHTMFNRKDTRKYRKWKKAYEKELQNHHIRNGQIRELEKFNNAAKQDIQNYLNCIERESQKQLDKLKTEREKRINLEANYAGKNQGLSEISS